MSEPMISLDTAMTGLRQALESRFDRLATKDDLREGFAKLKEELREELREEVAKLKEELREELRKELREMEERLRNELRAEMAQQVRAMEALFRQFFGALDEKYDHVPSQINTLRTDLDTHVDDASIHVPRRLP